MILDCIIRKKFHIYCPGCGGTRAIMQLLQLHIFKSIFYNPIPLCLIICVFLIFCSKRLEKISNNQLLYIKIRLKYEKMFFVIIFLNCIIKNFALIILRIDLLGNFK